MVARLDCYLNAIRIEVTADDRWTLQLAAPLGLKLGVGVYESAERYPFNEQDYADWILPAPAGNVTR
jgi:hypothetical protein